MKSFLRQLLILAAKGLRPLVFCGWLRRLALRLAAFILFPGRGLVLHGWPTVLNVRNLEVGAHCSINQGVFIQARERVVLGNHVTLSPYVLILDGGLEVSDVVTGAGMKEHRSAAVIIHDHVWVGAGAIILPGVTIGERSIVGAGAVVSHDLPAYSLALGVPARVVRSLVPDVS